MAASSRSRGRRCRWRRFSALEDDSFCWEDQLDKAELLGNVSRHGEGYGRGGARRRTRGRALDTEDAARVLVNRDHAWRIGLRI